jgi:hypothetical protein
VRRLLRTLKQLCGLSIKTGKERPSGYAWCHSVVGHATVEARPCLTIFVMSNLPEYDCTQCFVIAIAEFNNNMTNSEEVVIGDNASNVVDSQIESVVNDARIAPVYSTKTAYKEFLTHPVRIDHRVWTAASTSAVVTVDLLPLFFTTVAATAMGRKLANFSFAEMDLRIKIVVQGQPFAAGQIVAAFTPNFVSGAFGNEVTVTQGPDLSLVNSKIVPHIIIDPSKTATYEIDLPCKTPTGVWTFVSGAGSYSMEFKNFNALTSGTATAPTVTICTYMSLVDPDFQGLTLLSSPIISEKMEGGTASAFIKEASRFGKKIAHLTPIPKAVTLFSNFAAAGADVLALFGFAKPPNVENQLVVLNRQVDNYSQFEGKSTAAVLAGTAKNSVGLTSAYGGGKDDELRIHNLTSRPGLVHQLVVSQAAAAETLVSSMDINPTLCMGSGAPVVYQLTPLAGVSMMFGYWVGNIDVRVEFVASVFHRATFLIAWDPKALSTSAAPTLTTALQTLENVTVSVSGNEAVSVNIPWRQPISWRKVAQPRLVTDATVTRTTNGRFYIFVVNPITSNGSTDGIAINMYYSSNDIRYAAPDVHLIDDYMIVDEVLSEPLFCPETKVSFGQSCQFDGLELRSFGESYDSLKQLTSKLTPAATGQVVLTAGNVLPYLAWRIPNIVLSKRNSADIVTATRNNFFSWVSSGFLGYRGAIRWVAHSRNSACDEHPIATHMFSANLTDPSVLPTANPFPTAFLSEVLSSYAFTLQNRAISPNAEFVAPVLLPVDYQPARQRATGSTNCVDLLVGLSTVTTDTTVFVDLFNATADDGNFVMFLGFPSITLAT